MINTSQKNKTVVIELSEANLMLLQHAVQSCINGADKNRHYQEWCRDTAKWLKDVIDQEGKRQP